MLKIIGKGILVVFLAALMLGSAAGDNKLSKEHKKWLEEEVVYIITEQEKEEFLGLESDAEREEFIRKFWQKRDPTPGTLENEYQIEHYYRIKTAIRNFRERGRAGWKTDRGKVYIMFGPPHEVQNKAGSDANLDPNWRQDFKQGTDIFIWKYNVPANPFLAEHPELTFQRSPSGRYSLSGVSIYDLPPEAAFYRRSIPEDELKKALGQQQQEALAEMSAAEQALQELITSGTTKSEIGLELSVNYFPIQPPYCYLPLTLLINNKDLSFTEVEEHHRAELSVFGKVLQKEEGQEPKEVQRFSLPWQIDYTDEEYTQLGDKPDICSLGFPLLPGSYDLYLGVLDKGGNQLTTLARELEVPDFHRGDKLFISSVMFARNMNRLDAVHPALEKVTRNIIMGMMEIEVSPENIFHQSDEPTLFFYIAGASLNPETKKPDIQIEYGLTKGEEFIGKYPPQKYDIQAIAQPFPLAKFPPDDYIMEIKISDLVSGQEIVTSVKFKVI